MLKPIFNAAGAVMAAAMLAACGNAGPNESEIREAMVRWGKEMAGEQGAKTVSEMYGHMKLVACSKSDENGWRCDMTDPSMSGRFVKSDSGWIFMGK